MQKPDFSLSPSLDRPLSDIRNWVILAVATLAISGIAPLILLAGRASMFAEKELVKSLFHQALVVHVDLSVLAWFLAIALLFWSMLTQEKPSRIPFLRGAAAACFAVGCVFIAVAPLLGEGTALMSNYIPVFTAPLFFAGLSFLLVSVILGLIDVLLLPPAIPLQSDSLANPEGAMQRYGIIGAAYIVLLSIILFVWAHSRLEGVPVGTQDYYEVLFWAGGHGLQLAYTQLLLVAWLWLASAAGLLVKISPRKLLMIMSVYPLVATISPLGFMGNSLPYDMLFFTEQMRHGGGLGTVILALFLLKPLVAGGKPKSGHVLAWTCLVSSMAVFLVGGVIGHTITNSNTIIPAHYHGSIVGTTLAFMGVIYLLLPKLGWADVSKWKAAFVQPLLYGGGSIMHAVGLALAGGHGVARKTPGALEEAHAGAEAALQFMRLGGALAVIGGALFIVVVFRAARRG